MACAQVGSRHSKNTWLDARPSQGFQQSKFPVEGEVKASDVKWASQFRSLKEAVVLLFAYNLLKESQEPNVLTRTAQSHRGYKAEYYDCFREALLDTVVEVDEGNYPEELRHAWRKTIEPGLRYTASYRKAAAQKHAPGAR
jgi:hypothetical protein